MYVTVCIYGTHTKGVDISYKYIHKVVTGTNRAPGNILNVRPKLITVTRASLNTILIPLHKDVYFRVQTPYKAKQIVK